MSESAPTPTPDPLHQALVALERAMCAASDSSRELRDGPGLTRGVALLEPLSQLIRAAVDAGDILTRSLLGELPSSTLVAPAASAPHLEVVR